MTIIEDLLSEIKQDFPVHDVLVGANWTVVSSRSCGMASTMKTEAPHGHERVRDAGNLHLKSARELAEFSRSENLMEASIGLAAINSLVDLQSENPPRMEEIDAYKVLQEHGRGKEVAIVGHFPFLAKLRPQVAALRVIEQNPSQGEYPASAAPGLLPQAEVVAITGSALINQTLDELLGFCRPGAFVLILGPSTPLSPVLFEHGATMISGTRVVDETAVMRSVSQGASFQQVEGVQRVTLSRPAK